MHVAFYHSRIECFIKFTTKKKQKKKNYLLPSFICVFCLSLFCVTLKKYFPHFIFNIIN